MIAPDWKNLGLGFVLGVIVAVIMMRYETTVGTPGIAIMTDRWTGRSWRTYGSGPWTPIPLATPRDR